MAKAIFYYQKSVDQFGYVEGYLALGRLHLFGIGVPKNHQKALELLIHIADRTNGSIGHGVAQMMLGQIYYEGLGVQQNITVAREYYQKAAGQGYIFAYSALSALEWRSGNYLKSIKLRLKAILQALLITFRNPRDRRLRRS